MIASLKVLRDQANYREIAGLWLGLSTVLGLLGLFVSSLAVLFLNSMYAQGELSLVDYLIRMGLITAYAVCPAIGWLLFARRRYWAAIVVGTWPIFSMGVFVVVQGL